MQFTHILMDLDGTVFDFDYAEKAAFKDLCREYSIEYTEERYIFYQKVNDFRWKQLELGLISKDEVMYNRFEEFLSVYGIDGDSREMSRRFIELLVINTKPFDGAAETLKKLSERFVLDASTNASLDIQQAKLKSAGMEGIFHKLFVSEDMGFPKPARQFFDFIFSYYKGVPKEEFLLVGDSPSADIKGACDCGIKSVWVKNHKDYKGEAKPDFVIETLSDIENILREEK